MSRRPLCAVAHGIPVRCPHCLNLAEVLIRESRLAFHGSMVILYPTVIQPLFNELSPLPLGELRSRIEALAGKLEFLLKHLYEIDGSKRRSHRNAYFFGLAWVLASHIPSSRLAD